MTTDVASSDIDEPDGTCGREGCPIAEGGACLEGHGEALDCRFFELVPDDVAAPPVAVMRRVPLPDGEALRPSEAHRVLRSHPTSRVVPLGRVGAGKTTLMALSYQLVRARRLSVLKLAGSQTILGWARRAHHASFASGRVQPVTPRTEKEESGLLLHLDMRWCDDGRRAPVLFADLSGEHVEAISDGAQVAVVAEALGSADHVPVVVDGRRLADPDQRSQTVLEARSLLKMLEKFEVSPHCRVCLVVTKADLLVDHDINEALDAIRRGTVAEGCPVFMTADRGSQELDTEGEPTVALGDGVDEFLVHVSRKHVLSPGPAISVSTPGPSSLLASLWKRS